MSWRTVACALVAALAALPATASADRKPTAGEKRALTRATLKHCNRGGPPGESCKVHRIRVSTANRRWAWVFATRTGFSGALLHKRKGRWRVHATRGGGVNTCADWRDPPRKVVRDLRLKGLRDDGSYRRC